MIKKILKTDDVDLLFLNDDPFRIACNVIKNGKLLFCRDRSRLLGFIERTIKLYLDFKPVRDNFDKVFLKSIGYHG